MQDEDYFKRYEELAYMIQKAYIDRSILEGIEVYQSTVKNNQCKLKSPDIFAHWCELTKKDLGLLIWKLTDPSDEKSNTIITLKTYLRKTHGKIVKVKLNTQHTIDSLNTMRNQSLAHNDLNKSGTTISIADLYAALEDIRKYFNALCDTSIDSRVSTLNDLTNIGIINRTCRLLLDNSN